LPLALDILRVLLPALYALATANSVVVFLTRSPLARRIHLPVLAVTVGAHALYLVLRAAVIHRCPMGSVSEAMGLMAFSLVAVYFVLELRTGSRPTGILILPLAFLLEVVSAVLHRDQAPVNPALTKLWFNVHVLAAVLGVAALAVSFVHGILYLHLYRQIRDHKFGVFFRRLPPLAALNRMTNLATVVGWGLLTLTIAAGALSAWQDGRLEGLHRDPLNLIVVAAWAVYTAGLTFRFVVGWRGRYTAWLSVGGFALIVVSLTLVASLHGLH
jgi:ABC-type transport system involved in cytochrome c biogenesis permease subunit